MLIGRLMTNILFIRDKNNYMLKFNNIVTYFNYYLIKEYGRDGEHNYNEYI